MYQPKPIPYRVLSIDAGSRTGLGVAISEFTPEAMTVEHVSTYNVLALQKTYLDPPDRYDLIQEVIMGLIKDWKVQEVVVEDIFCNPRLVLAYRSLVLTLNAVRLAIRDTLGSEMHLIRANEAKHAVGVPMNNGDKTLVNLALQKPRDNLIIPEEIGLPYLDQHSNDSVAVGYGFYLTRFNGCKTDH
jgi:Holliday junction resolvasome RuvABC endonuclease subunit